MAFSPSQVREVASVPGNEVVRYTVGGSHGGRSRVGSWAQESRPSGSPGAKATSNNHLSVCLPDIFLSALTLTWDTYLHILAEPPLTLRN